MSPGLKAMFMERHGDLLTAEYWCGIQQRLEDGDAPRFSPYARDGARQG